VVELLDIFNDTIDDGLPETADINVVLSIAANPFLLELNKGVFKVINLLNDAVNGEVVITHSPMATNAVVPVTKLACIQKRSSVIATSYIVDALVDIGRGI
jgi:hypothetical protein